MCARYTVPVNLVRAANLPVANAGWQLDDAVVRPAAPGSLTAERPRRHLVFKVTADLDNKGHTEASLRVKLGTK